MTSDDRTITTHVATPRASRADGAGTTATLRARFGGYAVDMVILSAIAMLASIGTLFLFLLASDYAEQDISATQTLACLTPLLIGVPVVWSALNIALLLTRGQTGGQYVAALRVAPEGGASLSPRTACAWWFSGNPLLFSWPMAGIAGFPLLVAAALVPGDFELAAPLLLITLCLILPIVALVSALVDPRNRALHDRIAGVVVVPA
jgi:uncharacterized RDD family membrane protein YckC